MVAVSDESVVVHCREVPRWLHAKVVSRNYFSFFGLRPAAGRFFLEADSADRQEILDHPARAIGQMPGMSRVPAAHRALGAGRIYSTARDMARLVQLHLNLINKLPHSALSDLDLTLTDKLIRGKITAKRFPQAEPDRRSCVRAWWGWSDHEPSPYRAEWRQYCGTHNLRFSEYKLEWWAHLAVLIKGRDEYTPRITIRGKGGFLCVTESKFFQMVNAFRSVHEELQEVRPGVFTTKGGGTLDFTREVPT